MRKGAGVINERPAKATKGSPNKHLETRNKAVGCMVEHRKVNDTFPCSVTSEFSVSRPQATTKRSAHQRDARMGGRPIYRS